MNPASDGALSHKNGKITQNGLSTKDSPSIEREMRERNQKNTGSHVVSNVKLILKAPCEGKEIKWWKWR